MKELNIEQKAQRYDKALEKARQLCAYPTTKPFISDLQDIFPELAESEDEKIMKLLVEAVTQVLQDQYCSNRGVSKEKVVAWLEKQHKDSPILSNSSNIGKDEQKPAWSEEDENGFGDVLWAIQQARTIAKDENDMGNLWYAERLLKSLKDRCAQHQKQEWSGEDEAMWAEISDLLWEGYKQSGSKFSWDDIRNWINPKLKSLRPQNKWKPSDEQMEILQYLCENSSHPNKKVIPTLKSLFQDLKKLREE